MGAIDAARVRSFRGGGERSASISPKPAVKHLLVRPATVWVCESVVGEMRLLRENRVFIGSARQTDAYLEKIIELCFLTLEQGKAVPYHA